MGRSRRIVSSALILAIAAIAGVLLGELMSRWLVANAVRPPAVPASALQQAAPPVLPIPPPPQPRQRQRAAVIALEVDRTMHLDGGEPLRDAAALATALRGVRADVVYVAPGAGVPWAEVVDLVDRVRSLGVRVSLHDAPPE